MRKKWLAIYSKPRYEKVIEKALLRNQIECYLPKIKTLRQWSDRKKWVEIPLFTSYVFVKIGSNQYYDVLNTPGVVKFVSFEGNAVEIPEKQIEEIKWILSTEVSTKTVEENIPRGSKVEINKGPLKGLCAEMVNYNNKNSIIVRIDQLNKSFEIHIPRSNVKIIE